MYVTPKLDAGWMTNYEKSSLVSMANAHDNPLSGLRGLAHVHYPICATYILITKTGN
ncbi:predicted protein [Botrytis cinerea T4]|uniref:Uncharacterized protein n=1 Tax=Botryotinia fuckeliana (strain T4) TaxID=999810 RepID=G2YS53_BOTF4|nr:predicted protein [Botrytis cinerea T4]